MLGTTLKLNSPSCDCVTNLNKPVFKEGIYLIALELLMPEITVDAIKTAEVIAVEITVGLIIIEISNAREI